MNAAHSSQLSPSGLLSGRRLSASGFPLSIVNCQLSIPGSLSSLLSRSEPSTLNPQPSTALRSLLSRSLASLRLGVRPLSRFRLSGFGPRPSDFRSLLSIVNWLLAIPAFPSRPLRVSASPRASFGLFAALRPLLSIVNCQLSIPAILSRSLASLRLGVIPLFGFRPSDFRSPSSIVNCLLAIPAFPSRPLRVSASPRASFGLFAALRPLLSIVNCQLSILRSLLLRFGLRISASGEFCTLHSAFCISA